METPVSIECEGRDLKVKYAGDRSTLSEMLSARLQTMHRTELAAPHLAHQLDSCDTLMVRAVEGEDPVDVLMEAVAAQIREFENIKHLLKQSSSSV